MENVTNQTRMLKNLLSRFTDIIYIDQAELDFLYQHIFSVEEASSPPKQSELYETVFYFRSIVIEKGFTTLQQLIDFFDRETSELKGLIEPFLITEKASSELNIPDINFACDSFRTSSVRLLTTGNSRIKLTNYSDLVNHIYTVLLDKIILVNKTQNYKEFVRTEVCNKAILPLKHTSCRVFNTDKTHYYLEHYIESFGFFRESVSLFRKFFNVFNSFQKTQLKKPPFIFKSLFLKNFVHRKKIKSLFLNLFNAVKAEQPIYGEDIKKNFSHMMVFSKITNPDFRKRINTISVSATDNIDMADNMKVYDITIEIAKEIYSKYFVKKIWSILKSPIGLSWITSDNPGFSLDIKPLIEGNFDVHADPLWTAMGENSAVYFPLSKDYCLRLRPVCNKIVVTQSDADHIISFEQSSKQELEVVNCLILSSKPTVVISEEKGILLQCKVDCK